MDKESRPRQVPPPVDVQIEQFREEMERRIGALESQVQALQRSRKGIPGPIVIFGPKAKKAEVKKPNE